MYADGFYRALRDTVLTHGTFSDAGYVFLSDNTTPSGRVNGIPRFLALLQADTRIVKPGSLVPLDYGAWRAVA
ncbi:MAG: hypothetical protein Q6373_007345, partial [Candidatus Sigynarchaeota archaeon]